MTGLGQDLRQSVRMLRHNPGFALVTILTLAIGIGTSTTVFSWIDAVLLRPLSGVANPTVGRDGDDDARRRIRHRIPTRISCDYRDHLKLLDGIAVTRPAAFSVGEQDHAERVWGELVSGNFFAVLGVKPQLGRVFLPAEYGDKPGAYPVAVISDRYWRSHFQADPRSSARRCGSTSMR